MIPAGVTVNVVSPAATDTALEIAGRVRPRGRVLMATATAARMDTGSVIAEFEALLFPRPIEDRPRQL